MTYPGADHPHVHVRRDRNRTAKNATTYTYDNADQLTAVGGTSYGYQYARVRAVIRHSNRFWAF